MEVIAGILYRQNHWGIQKSQLCTATRPVHRWTCRRNHRGIPNINSVRWRDRFTDEKCRQNHQGIQNGSSVRWRDRFTNEKCRRNHRGIQNGSSVWWRVLFTVRIADGITDRIGRRWIRRQKLIYPLSLDSVLPYFSFFFLISTLPNCKQPAPLSENISLFSTQ